MIRPLTRRFLVSVSGNGHSRPTLPASSTGAQDECHREDYVVQQGGDLVEAIRQIRGPTGRRSGPGGRAEYRSYGTHGGSSTMPAHLPGASLRISCCHCASLCTHAQRCSRNLCGGQALSSAHQKLIAHGTAGGWRVGLVRGWLWGVGAPAGKRGHQEGAPPPTPRALRGSSGG